MIFTDFGGSRRQRRQNCNFPNIRARKDSFGNLTSNAGILHTAQVLLIVYVAETVNSLNFALFGHPHDTIKILKTKKLSRSLYNSILRILVLH